MRRVFLLLMVVVFCVSCSEAAEGSRVFVVGMLNFPSGTSEVRSDILTQKVVGIMEEGMEWHAIEVKKQFNVFSGKSEQFITSIVVEVDLSSNKRFLLSKAIKHKTDELKEVYVDFVEVKQLCDFGIQFQLELNEVEDRSKQVSDFIRTLKGIKNVQQAIQTSPLEYSYQKFRVNIGQLEKYGVKEEDILESLGFSSKEVPFVLDVENNCINREFPIEIRLPNLNEVEVVNSRGERIPVSEFAGLSFALKVEKSVTITVVPSYQTSGKVQDVLEAVMKLTKAHSFDSLGFISYYGDNDLGCE